METDGPVARIVLATDEAAGVRPGYELKLNSYDLGVDIELHDAVQRLRFEHPEVRAVVITSGLDKVSGTRFVQAPPRGADHGRPAQDRYR
jgi:benzoyl-CoA-dihydrodiol lyase